MGNLGKRTSIKNCNTKETHKYRTGGNRKATRQLIEETSKLQEEVDGINGLFDKVFQSQEQEINTWQARYGFLLLSMILLMASTGTWWPIFAVVYTIFVNTPYGYENPFRIGKYSKYGVKVEEVNADN